MMYRWLWLLVLGVTAIAVVPRSSGRVQSITGTGELSVLPGERFVLSVSHHVDAGHGHLPGIALRVHYDSRKLQFLGFRERHFQGASESLSIFDPTPRAEGVGADDGDDSTDAYIHIALADLEGSWPEGGQPTAIATLEFAPIDLVPGDRTAIRFTPITTAPGNAFIGIPAVVDVEPGVELEADQDHFEGAGDSGDLGVVTARPDLAWQAAANVDWILLQEPVQGIGPGRLGFSLAPNASVHPRTGGITVNGQVFTVHQEGLAPVFSLSPVNVSAGHSGGAGTITVTAQPGDAEWTASSDAGWLTLGNASGVGSGTVNYVAHPIASAYSRTATIRVGAAVATVTQAGAPVIVQPKVASLQLPHIGGTHSTAIEVTPADGAWSASSNAPWLRLAHTTGSGPGAIGFQVDPNSSTVPRQAIITVGGGTIAVTQAGQAAQMVSSETETLSSPPGGTVRIPLEYNVLNSSNALPGLSLRVHYNSAALTFVGFEGVSAFGAAVQTVTAPQLDSANFDGDAATDRYVTITWTHGGSGWPGVPLPALVGEARFTMAAAQSTVVRFSAASTASDHLFLGNPVRIEAKPGGQDSRISVTPTAVRLGAEGGSQTLTISATPGDAAWDSAVTVDWITLDKPSGTGSDSVRLIVGPNAHIEGRLAVVNVAGINVTVAQDGTAPTFTLESETLEFPAGGGIRSVAVTAFPSNATWRVDSLPSWVDLEGDTVRTGTGVVVFQLLPNPLATGRTATIQVAGISLIIKQLAGTSRSVWADADTGENGRFESPWFGTFWMFEGHEWYYHVEHGWIYADVFSQDITHWFMINIGWTFTNPAYHPWFYRYETQSWIYYLVGTGTGGVRWFYDTGVNDWFGIGPSGIPVAP